MPSLRALKAADSSHQSSSPGAAFRVETGLCRCTENGSQRESRAERDCRHHLSWQSAPFFRNLQRGIFYLSDLFQGLQVQKNPLMTGLNLTFCLLNPLLLILSPLDTAKKNTPFLLIAIYLYLSLPSCLLSSPEKAHHTWAMNMQGKNYIQRDR